MSEDEDGDTSREDTTTACWRLLQKRAQKTRCYTLATPGLAAYPQRATRPTPRCLLSLHLPRVEPEPALKASKACSVDGRQQSSSALLAQSRVPAQPPLLLNCLLGRPASSPSSRPIAVTAEAVLVTGRSRGKGQATRRSDCCRAHSFLFPSVSHLPRPSLRRTFFCVWEVLRHTPRQSRRITADQTRRVDAARAVNKPWTRPLPTRLRLSRATLGSSSLC